jgi:chromate transporter
MAGLWILFSSFFRIGLFTFGGGYAMVPMIQRELTANHWMSLQQFSDIVAISQITPGPLAINAATYVGYLVAGIPGSAAATLGVSLPPMLMITGLSHLLAKAWDRPVTQSIFYGLRPVVVALIGTATIFFAESSLFRRTQSGDLLERLSIDPLGTISPVGLALFALALLFTARTKLHPIALILLSGLASLLVLTLWPALS